MIDRNPRHLPHWVDWQVALLADTAGRADSLAGSIAAEALEHPDDPQLAAWCGLADRIGRDLDRLLVEFDGPTIETRSRAVWGDAA